MFFLKSSISIMSYDFKSKFFSSSVLGYPGLVMGELGLDGAMLPCFLLVTLLHLPFAIWLSLVLVSPAVTGWCCLCACKLILAPLGDWLSPGTDCCGAVQLLGAGRALTD